jgi:hypothetical protein
VAASNITYSSSDISWLPVKGAKSYEIILNKTTVIPVVLTKYTLTNLKVGSNNTVEVRAKSDLKVGGVSAPITVTTLSEAPKNLLSADITSTSYILNWQSIPNATSYNLYRDGAVLMNVKTNTYTANNLVPGTSNSYTVSAVFATGETAQSSAVSVATLLSTPSKPLLVSTSTLTADISWQLDPNAVSYSLNLYDSTGTVLVNTATVEKSLKSYQFTALSPNTTYSVGILNNYLKRIYNSTLKLFLQMNIY